MRWVLVESVTLVAALIVVTVTLLWVLPVPSPRLALAVCAASTVCMWLLYRRWDRRTGGRWR